MCNCEIISNKLYTGQLGCYKLTIYIYHVKYVHSDYGQLKLHLHQGLGTALIDMRQCIPL